MSNCRRSVVPALLATAGLMLWPIGTASAQPPQTCNGLAATQVGTNGDDVLFGTNGPDVFVTLGGDDVVFGLNSNDTAYLGPVPTSSSAAPETTGPAEKPVPTP